VTNVDVFAEIEPNQKERIILALRKAGHVVGHMGDGINDASALHAADVGISVDTAVDVAKDAADIVLPEKDLAVLVEGVREGRATFANTLKYVFMATSANFGNIVQHGGIPSFCRFSRAPQAGTADESHDRFPEMTIATDSVDDEMVNYRDGGTSRRSASSLVTFGILSSVFDYLTFGLLLLVLHATRVQFRTGWFWNPLCPRR